MDEIPLTMHSKEIIPAAMPMEVQRIHRARNVLSLDIRERRRRSWGPRKNVSERLLTKTTSIKSPRLRDLKCVPNGGHHLRYTLYPVPDIRCLPFPRIYVTLRLRLPFSRPKEKLLRLSGLSTSLG
jgi:hypothetical protein